MSSVANVLLALWLLLKMYWFEWSCYENAAVAVYTVSDKDVRVVNRFTADPVKALHFAMLV